MKEKDKQLCEYFGNQVRKYRKAVNISQDDLAATTNLTRTSIVNMEAGKQRPSLECIFLICCTLKCTPNDLFPPVEQIEFVTEERTVMVPRVYKTRTIKIKGNSAEDSEER